MRRAKTVFTLIAVFVGSLLALSPVAGVEQASDVMELTVSPTSTRIDLEAGRTTDGEFMIFNSGEVPIDVDVYASPYGVKNENYDGDYETENARSQIVRWIKFDQTQYHLEPRQQETVRYTVETPQSIPDGGQYAVLFAAFSSEAATAEGGSFNTIKRVGSLLYATTDGETKDSGFVEGTTINGWQTEQPVTVTQRITNDGNTDFVATTRTTLTNLFGKEVASVGTPEQVILPETTRATEISFEEKIMPGFYKVNVESTFLGQTNMTEKWILVAPFWTIYLFAVIILAIIMLIIWLAGRGHRKSKAMRNSLAK